MNRKEKRIWAQVGLGVGLTSVVLWNYNVLGSVLVAVSFLSLLLFRLEVLWYNTKGYKRPKERDPHANVNVSLEDER